MSERDDKIDAGRDAEFAQRVVEQLDQRVDDDVAARLRAARQEAVYAADRRSARSRLWLAPAGGAVAAAVVAAILLREPGVAPLPMLDEQELAAATDLEFLEALEMLAWMEEESARDAG